MQGDPRTMQENPVYEDVVADILQWLGTRIYQTPRSGCERFDY